MTVCLDCHHPYCIHVSRPLGATQLRALVLIEATPGICRTELGRLLWPKKNDYYSRRKAVNTCKTLERRGLIEFDLIHEGGRAGVPGLYRVGQPRPVKPGYLGINGWVHPKGTCDQCGGLPLVAPEPYCLECIKRLVRQGLGGKSLKEVS